MSGDIREWHGLNPSHACADAARLFENLQVGGLCQCTERLIAGGETQLIEYKDITRPAAEQTYGQLLTGIKLLLDVVMQLMTC